MKKPLRYWVRRAVVSFPVWLFFVHEMDTRTYDNGERVFLDYEGMFWWTAIIWMIWITLDYHVSHRVTPIRKDKQ